MHFTTKIATCSSLHECSSSDGFDTGGGGGGGEGASIFTELYIPFLFLHVLWALVYPTTSVPIKCVR